MSVAVILSWAINPPLYVPPKSGVVLELPDRVGDYHGLKAAFTPAETRGLPPDTGFARKEYFNSTGDDILCSIVLSGAGQNSIHRPEACLAGQGWSIVGQEDVPINLLSGHLLVIRNLTLEREQVDADRSRRTERRFYMYWFVGENITTPSHFTRILLSSWDRVVHNRAHRWAFVIATAPITEGERIGGLNADQTRAMLSGFIRQIVPAFQKSEMTSDPAGPSAQTF